MKVFKTRLNENSEDIGIITLSHGPLAMGIYESLKLIIGRDIENFACISLDENDEMSRYNNEIQQVL